MRDHVSVQLQVSVWTFHNWIPVIGYPCNLHINYVYFNGFLRTVYYTFQNLWKALQAFLLKKSSQKTLYILKFVIGMGRTWETFSSLPAKKTQKFETVTRKENFLTETEGRTCGRKLSVTRKTWYWLRSHLAVYYGKNA